MPEADAVLRPSRKRVTFAFLVAPLAPGLVQAALMILAGAFTGWGIGTIIVSFVILPFFILFFTALLGYPIAFLLGVPVYRLLIKYGYYRWTAYTAACALLGTMSYPSVWIFAYEVHQRPLPSFGNAVGGVAFGAAYGAIAGFTFWSIVRPDRASQIETAE